MSNSNLRLHIKEELKRYVPAEDLDSTTEDSFKYFKILDLNPLEFDLLESYDPGAKIVKLTWTKRELTKMDKH